MFLALQNPSYLTERPPLKKLYIPIICCYFSISHPLRCHCSYRPHHFITVPFSFLCLSTCLQRRQSIAPPEGTISAILLHVQKRKTITVLFFFFFFLYLASWQNKIDTYFGMITPLFINLVQKILLILPAHRHTIVGNAY